MRVLLVSPPGPPFPLFHLRQLFRGRGVHCSRGETAAQLTRGMHSAALRRASGGAGDGPAWSMIGGNSGYWVRNQEEALSVLHPNARIPVFYLLPPQSTFPVLSS